MNVILDLISTKQYQFALELLQDLNSITAESYLLKAACYEGLGDLDMDLKMIQNGIQLDPFYYELYLALGNYYHLINDYTRAYLCYEHSLFLCDNVEDRCTIQTFWDFESCMVEVPKTSIIILSYNTLDLTRDCINSIRRHNPSSAYDLIVIDNASTDGSREWLLEQKDIKLICNSQNKGFPYACNQGIKASDPYADIFLLNSDTILFHNSLFLLRMGLYSDPTIGAVGSISNCAGNEQKISDSYSAIQEYEAFALTNNIFSDSCLEQKFLLIGFAMLLRRNALDDVGILDLRFSPGQFEDMDLGFRLHRAGWKNILCHNSFIFHYGGSDGQNNDLWEKQLKINSQKFTEKWGFDPLYYTHSRQVLIDKISHPKDALIRVLEIGCGMGSTLSKIKYLYPNSEIYGIELVDSVSKLGNLLCPNIVQGNIETDPFPFESVKFDYIIFGDVLEHLHAPEEILKKLQKYLSPNGRYICSLPNLMHVSALLPLIYGHFDYEDAGILDRTHLRFFTYESILKLFDACGLAIQNFGWISDGSEHSSEYQLILSALKQLPGEVPVAQYCAYQYIFEAIPKSSS